MSGDLTKYNAAKRALAEAVRVDEVKDIRDKAVAMRVYAMQARDRVLIDQATEIRLRAERRAGELLRDMEKNKGTRGDGRPKKGGSSARPPKDTTPKLSELDINKSQSSRWQKLADVSDSDFEELVTRAKQKACDTVDRVQQPVKKKAKSSTAKKTAASKAKPETAAPAIDGTSTAADFGKINLPTSSVEKPWPADKPFTVDIAVKRIGHAFTLLPKREHAEFIRRVRELLDTYESAAARAVA
jgi:hypothetical protein